MPFKKTLLTLLLFSAAYQNSAAKEPLLYSVTDVSWEPYWIVEQGEARGIFSDLMKSIAPHVGAGLTAESPYPVKRAQMMFERGDIAVECCINQAWRSPTDSAGETLWTETVLTTHEVVVFPAAKPLLVKTPADLAGKEVATILGYGYIGDKLFKRNDVLDNIAQLKLVAYERVDAAVVDIHELSYLLRSDPSIIELKDKITIGEKVGSSALKMRINSQHPELLPALNAEIRRMKQSGKMKAIVDRYIQ